WSLRDSFAGLSGERFNVYLWLNLPRFQQANPQSGSRVILGFGFCITTVCVVGFDGLGVVFPPRGFFWPPGFPPRPGLSPPRLFSLRLASFAASVFWFVFSPPVFCITLLGRFWLGRRSEEHTSELQSRENLVCRLL